MTTRAASPPRRLVELIGPAGAGKSTLARALPERNPSIQIGPTIWGLPAPHLLLAALTLLPTITRAMLEGDQPRWLELAQMIRLRALRTVVASQVREGGGVLLLDEGPLFGLAWLEVYHALHGSSAQARWRRRQLAHWAARLDSVVWLDAGDSTLARRVGERPRPHRLKGQPNRDMEAFARRYRAAFTRVLAGLRSAGQVSVHHLRTDDASPDQAAEQLQCTLARPRRGR